MVEIEVEGKGMRKGRKHGPDELEDLVGLEAELLRLSSSFGQQRAARSREPGRGR